MTQLTGRQGLAVVGLPLAAAGIYALVAPKPSQSHAAPTPITAEAVPGTTKTITPGPFQSDGSVHIDFSNPAEILEGSKVAVNFLKQNVAGGLACENPNLVFVSKGDTLSSIVAKRLDNNRRYRDSVLNKGFTPNEDTIVNINYRIAYAIGEANGHINPDLIPVSTSILLPAAPVLAGLEDTLGKLATAFEQGKFPADYLSAKESNGRGFIQAVLLTSYNMSIHDLTTGEALSQNQGNPAVFSMHNLSILAEQLNTGTYNSIPHDPSFRNEKFLAAHVKPKRE